MLRPVSLVYRIGRLLGHLKGSRNSSCTGDSAWKISPGFQDFQGSLSTTSCFKHTYNIPCWIGTRIAGRMAAVRDRGPSARAYRAAQRDSRLLHHARLTSSLRTSRAVCAATCPQQAAHDLHTTCRKDRRQTLAVQQRLHDPIKLCADSNSPQPTSSHTTANIIAIHRPFRPSASVIARRLLGWQQPCHAESWVRVKHAR